MILIGKLKSGLGEASFWMKKTKKAFEKRINLKVFHGTLNLEIQKNYILEGNIEIIHKEEYGGTQEVYLKKCNVLGHKSYIIRTDKNMSKNRRPMEWNKCRKNRRHCSKKSG